MRMRLKYVFLVKDRHGKPKYAYFRRDGKTVRLPNPDTREFLPRYERLLAQFDAETPVTGAGTVGAVIKEYRASPEYRTKLSANSKTSYESYLKHIVGMFGKHQIKEIEIQHVYQMRDLLAVKVNKAGVETDSPGRANLAVAVLGAVMVFAIKRRHRTDNPCKDVDRLEMGEHQPWEQDAIAGAIKKAGPMLRLAISLLLYTGQRIGDVCAITYSAIKDGRIDVVQQKTGKVLSIPIHRELWAAIDAVPREGLHLIHQPGGKPFTTQTLRNHLAKLAPDSTPHGLRKNAVNMLLEAGCSTAEVQAITGQSPEMVAHYAKGVDQKSLSGAAILKWEQKAKVQNKN